MRITISRSRGPSRPKPREGDIKTCKAGVFVRRWRRHDGANVVSNNRPVYEWVRTGDAPEGFTGRPVIEYRESRL